MDALEDPAIGRRREVPLTTHCLSTTNCHGQIPRKADTTTLEHLLINVVIYKSNIVFELLKFRLPTYIDYLLT